MSETSRHYRFYLCETTLRNPLSWRCGRASAEEALACENVCKHGDNPSKVVLVPNTVPRILDVFFLHYAMHPHVQMSI